MRASGLPTSFIILTSVLLGVASNPNNYIALSGGAPADPRHRHEVGGWYYYGPKYAHLVDVPAIYLTGYELCSESDAHRTMRKEAKGKVVVSDLLGATCWFNVIYEGLNNDGAVAMVDLGASPAAGMWTYAFYSMDRRDRLKLQQKQETTVVVSLPRRYVMPDGSKAQTFFKSLLLRPGDEGKGKAGEISRLTIHLDDPEANRFARLFKSGWWIVFMQFVMPIGLLTVCANAFAQIIIERERRLARSESLPGHGQDSCSRSCSCTRKPAEGQLDTLREGWSVCELVCVVEVPSLLAMAVLYACGQWGRYQLLAPVHLFGMSGVLFSACNYTTMVLSFYMREQTQRGGAMDDPYSFWRCVHTRPSSSSSPLAATSTTYCSLADAPVASVTLTLLTLAPPTLAPPPLTLPTLKFQNSFISPRAIELGLV